MATPRKSPRKSELENFRARIADFLARNEMSPRRFGTLACNDSHLIADLDAGREPRAATKSAVLAFMASYAGLAPRSRDTPKRAGKPAARARS